MLFFLSAKKVDFFFTAIKSYSQKQILSQKLMQITRKSIRTRMKNAKLQTKTQEEMSSMPFFSLQSP